jgi:hypothetical protein
MTHDSFAAEEVLNQYGAREREFYKIKTTTQIVKNKGAGDSSSSTNQKWIHQLLHLLQRKESPVWAVLLE